MTRVGAGVVILDSTRSTVLLLRYVKNGEWGRPGGAVEAGESSLDAVVREVVEETGLDLRSLADAGHVRLIDWTEGALQVPPVPWVAAGFAVVLPSDWPLDTIGIREPQIHDAIEWESVEVVLQGKVSCGQPVNPFTLSTLKQLMKQD